MHCGAFEQNVIVQLGVLNGVVINEGNGLVFAAVALLTHALHQLSNQGVGDVSRPTDGILYATAGFCAYIGRVT